MIIRKEELIDTLAARETVSKKFAKDFLDEVFEIIAEELSKGNEIDIHGFGKFEVKEQAERFGVSPRTGEKVKIEASKKVKFTQRKALKERVN